MQNLFRRPSGVYGFRLTVPTNLRPVFGKREIIITTGTTELTIAELLRGGGYRTLISGKWHVGATSGRGWWTARASARSTGRRGATLAATGPRRGQRARPTAPHTVRGKDSPAQRHSASQAAPPMASVGRGC